MLKKPNRFNAYAMDILWQTPGKVYWKDLEGNYLGCNQNMLNFLGLASVAELLGRKEQDFLLNEEKIKKMMLEDEQVICSGKSLLIEEEIREVNGVHAYLTQKIPLRDNNEVIVGIIVSIIDVTSYKNHLLNQIYSLKSKFLNFIVHKLRGPISNIVSAVDLLKNSSAQKSSSEKKPNSLTPLIEQEAYKALEILKNINYYVDLDPDQFESNRAFVFLKGFLSRIYRKYKTKILNGVDFKCTLLAPENTRIEFDMFHTMQILKIILDNAVKYTAQGSIDLSVSIDTEKKFLKFTLSDTGIGMSETYLQEVFFNFFIEEQPSVKKTYLKSGLKLPLAKRIAELAGGNFFLESVQNEGTTATVLMPYEIAHYPAECQLEDNVTFPSSAVPEKNYFPLSILLVEDDAHSAWLSIEILRDLGCHVIWANHALQALEILRQKSFDLIFIDITLPDMSGIALAHALQAMIADTTHLVALSAHVTEKDHEYFLRLGLMTLLAKPITHLGFKTFFEDYMRMIENPEN